MCPSQIQERSYRAKQFAFLISWPCRESRAHSPRRDLGIAVFPHKPFTFPVPAPSRSSGKSRFCPSPTFIQEEPQQRWLRQNVFGKAKQEAAKIRGLGHGVVSRQGPEGCVVAGGLRKRRPRLCSNKGQIQHFPSAFGTALPPSAPQPPTSRASEGAKRARHQSDLRAASSSCLPKTNPETLAPPLCPLIHLHPTLPSALTSFRE